MEQRIKVTPQAEAVGQQWRTEEQGPVRQSSARESEPIESSGNEASFWEREVPLPSWLGGARHPSARDVRSFLRQFSTMMAAGLPVPVALEVVLGATRASGMHRVLESVLQDVRSGVSLADAIAGHPRVFLPLVSNLVRAGEASGRLGTVLERVSTYLDAQQELRSKLQGAMLYPFVVLLFSLAVSVFLVVVMVPNFVAMLSQLGGQLPWVTRLLMSLSDTLRQQGALLLFLGLMGLMGPYAAQRTTAGRLWLSREQMRIPWMGDVIRKAAIARYSETLAVVLATGIPLAEAMQLATPVVENETLRTALEDMERAVRHGATLSGALASQPAFVPSFVIAMLAAGEAAGSVGSSLEQVAIAYALEVRERLHAFTLLLEPLFVVVLGAVVSVIVAAMFLPLYEIIGELG